MAERRVWASAHGIRACLPYMAHGDIYAPGVEVMLRWHKRTEPLYVVGETPDWVPAAVDAVHI